MDYTKEYYKKHAPRYSLSRMAIVVDWLRKISKHESSLIDIGCGDGSSLSYIKEQTGIKEITGLDNASNYLKTARRNFDNLNFLEGDICNLDIKKKYDFVIIVAVLHHLVGTTRNESKKLAGLAIDNCLKLLKEGGRLVVMEPVFSNSILMGLLFYVKKFFSNLSANRISLFGYWNNIGAPVVSYFSVESLTALIKGSGGKIVEEKYVTAKNRSIYRLLKIRRGDLYLLVRKD